MGTAQVTFTEEELLLDPVIAEPLVVDGMLCHGGFDGSGTYVSPRTRFRVPAIEAWEAQRVEQFGTARLAAEVDDWPESFPNVAQTKHLLRAGVTEPVISSLTRIGTVEGFGGMLRLLPIPTWQDCFVEDVTGTAIAHIGTGLFEAHARDEAGHGDVAGHDKMWFAARDLAFDRPVTENETMLMLERMGIAPAGSSRPDPAKAAAAAAAGRVLPDDIDLALEITVGRMISLLFIEIVAFHSFRWAEGVLSDHDLVAGEGRAAELISHIRADETPHVGYLITALSEMRDRTWKGTTGATYAGTEMVGQLWNQWLEQSTMLRRDEGLRMALDELRRSVAGRPDAEGLLAETLALGDVQVEADGTVVDGRSAGLPRFVEL